MLKEYGHAVQRLLLPAVMLVLVLAACDNPQTPANTPVAGNTAPQQTGGQVEVATKGPTKTPDITTAEGRLDSGNTHFENNEFNEAIADYTEAIKLQPDLAPAY